MITGVLLARNEESNIVGCLEALRPHVAEILLIDMESTDRTVELARPHVAKLLRHPTVRNFDGARNLAIAEAQYEWLWFVDADERIPTGTGKLVNDLVRTRGHEFEALTIPFKSYCCGQWMRHCGWWPGYTGPRVLKRGHFQFADQIHGGVRLDGRELLVAPDPALGIDHYGIRDVAHYVDKVNRYSTAQAENLAEEGARWDWRAAIDDMIREMWRCYERHPGRLDGERGWIVAWLSGQYQWLCRTKLIDLMPGRMPNPNVVPTDLDEAIQRMQDALARLRAKGPRAPLGLVWRADLWNESGYAEEARTFVKALAGGPRPMALVDNYPENRPDIGIRPEDAALFRSLLRARRPRHVLSVTHALPTTLPPDDRAAVNVLRTMFETDRVPEHWLTLADRFDEIWVPSRHVSDAFRRSGMAPEKIRVVPGCLDADVFRPDGEKVGLPEALHGRFVYLSVFDWVPRKGCDLLLESYCQEFRPDEGVGLLLKLTRVHGQPLEEIRDRLDRLLETWG